MKRADVLKIAEQAVTEDRNNKYGEPEDNFARIAGLWNVYLRSVLISPQDVANMMILFKVARLMEKGGTEDTYIDIAGYAACGGEILDGEGEHV